MTYNHRVPFYKTDSFIGIIYSVLGYACFAISDTSAKWLTGHGYPLFQILLFNGIFGSLSMLVYRRIYPGGRGFFKSDKMTLHYIRAALLVTTGLGIIYALRTMPLVRVHSILFTTPIMVCALSVFILKEKVRWVRWTVIALAFIGVLIMIHPTLITTQSVQILPTLAALWAAFSAALAMIMVKIIGKEKNKARLSLIPHLMLIPIALMFLGVNGFMMPVGWHWVLLIGGGCFVGSALLFVSLAYDTARASTVAPFEYSMAIWSVLLGYLVFGHMPTFHVIAGAIVIILCGLFIVYRERHLRRIGILPR